MRNVLTLGNIIQAGLDTGWISKIQRDQFNLGIGVVATNAGNGIFAKGWISAGQDNKRSGCSQRAGGFIANAAIGAGHHGNFS